MLWWWKLILYHYCCLYFGRKIHTKYKKKHITSFIKFNAGFFIEARACIRLAFNDLLGFQKEQSADFLGHLLCWSLGALIQEWHTLWLAFKVAFVFEHRMRCTQPRIRRGILPLTKCIKEFNKYCLEKSGANKFWVDWKSWSDHKKPIFAHFDNFADSNWKMCKLSKAKSRKLTPNGFG